LHKALDKAAIGATQMDSFHQSEWTAFDGFLRSHPHGMTDSLQVQERFRLGKRLREKELAFIRSHSNLYYSLWFFRSEVTSTWYIDTDTLFAVFNSFPDSLRYSIEGTTALRALQARIDSREGMIAPGYAARTIKGDSISSGTNAGKYVLLVFWASWCGPCRAEMPSISELKSQYAGKRFSIISISLDRNRKDFESALAKYKMDWPQIFDDRDLIKAFNVSAIPAIFLIDPAGRIIYKNGEENTSGMSTSDPDLKRLIAMLGERLEKNH
jgi:thiol-disulfide isomerase/thioredoxin